MCVMKEEEIGTYVPEEKNRDEIASTIKSVKLIIWSSEYEARYFILVNSMQS